MSVAEETYSQSVPRSPQAQLAGGSFLGAFYVLGSLILVLGLLPAAWDQLLHPPRTSGQLPLINEFLSGALLLLTTLVAGTALGFVGYRLLKANEIHGLRAGIFVACIFLWIIASVTFSAGNMMQGEFGDNPVVGVVITLAIGAALLFAAFRLFLSQGFYHMLVSMEDQGWFHATAYKPSQGFKVRRATVLGVLTLGLCGIITLINHGTLGREIPGGPANDWFWWIPFTSSTPVPGSPILAYQLPLMHKVHVVVPILLGLGLIWFAWRLVNWPIFADFLIATEAEINKVSWTTRKRLFQDTIVVLVTVIILTTFLFAIDILWIKVLSHPWIRVLQVDLKAEQMKQQEKTQW